MIEPNLPTNEKLRLVAILQRCHAVGDKSSALAHYGVILNAADEEAMRQMLYDAADTLYAAEYWIRSIIFPTTIYGPETGLPKGDG